MGDQHVKYSVASTSSVVLITAELILPGQSRAPSWVNTHTSTCPGWSDACTWVASAHNGSSWSCTGWIGPCGLLSWCWLCSRHCPSREHTTTEQETGWSGRAGSSLRESEDAAGASSLHSLQQESCGSKGVFSPPANSWALWTEEFRPAARWSWKSSRSRSDPHQELVPAWGTEASSLLSLLAPSPPRTWRQSSSVSKN